MVRCSPIQEHPSVRSYPPRESPEYRDSGNQVHTLESTDWEAELHSCINDQDITLDETSQDLPEPSVPSDKDVIRALEVLKLYAFHNPSVLGSIISTESVVCGHIVGKRCHMSQKCLTEFFKV